jgi:hypothetical protein
MRISGHSVFIWTMVLIVVTFTVYTGYVGFDFYTMPVEQRFFHPKYEWFKPSGLFGHGLGIVGTILITIGVILYIARKKYGFLGRLIRLRHMLEFHIFLCTLGPIMVLFHTTFKFGGIVSVAFWSMVAVVLSGVIGRYIHVRIPRNVEGHEMTLQEVRSRQDEMFNRIRNVQGHSLPVEELLWKHQPVSATPIRSWFVRRKLLSAIRRRLASSGIHGRELISLMKEIKLEWELSRRVDQMHVMQRLMRSWHVIHRPFALIMLVIVIIHIIVALILGYTWIF